MGGVEGEEGEDRKGETWRGEWRGYNGSERNERVKVRERTPVCIFIFSL